MAGKIRIPCDVPVQVRDWLQKRSDEHVRSIKGEATFILIEKCEQETGLKVEMSGEMQDDLEDAGTEA